MASLHDLQDTIRITTTVASRACNELVHELEKLAKARQIANAAGSQKGNAPPVPAAGQTTGRIDPRRGRSPLDELGDAAKRTR